MNARHPMGVLHSFSIKSTFYDKMDFRLFYFDVAKWRYSSVCNIEIHTGIPQKLFCCLC